MELMQKAMIHRRENDANARQECDPAEQRITPGEQLAAGCVKFPQRSHPGQDHGCIHKRIQQGKLFEIMIPGHANRQ